MDKMQTSCGGWKRVRMGVVKDPPNSICCQNCKRSIAMLFPSSECDCIGGKEK